MKVLRYVQLLWYSLLVLAVITTATMLLYILKKRQYLYYEDHKFKFRV